MVLSLVTSAAAQTPDAGPPTGTFPADSAAPPAPPPEPPAQAPAVPESAPIPLPAAPPPPPPAPAAPSPPAVRSLPQFDPYAVVVRLRVDEPVDLAFVYRKRKQPAYELARCSGSCDIAIRPGRYRLEVGDSPDTRAGVVSFDVTRAGTYHLKPSARDTLLPGAILAALGPAVMGAGIGIVAAQTADETDGPLYWAGAGIFAAGSVITGAGYYLYADRPRVTFAAGDVPPDRALGAGPTQMPNERELSYQEGQPVPPGYHVRREPKKGLLTTGILMFGISYGIMAALGTAALIDEDETDENEKLLIPVVGPLFLVRDDSDDGGGLLLFGTAPQAAGLALIMAGALSERLTLVPDAGVRVAPLLAPGTAGMVVGGQL